MRLALVNSYYAPDRIGGAEIFVELLARGLVERGHEVKVFCTSFANGIDTVDGIVVQRFVNHNVYWPPLALKPSLSRRAVWHLRECYNRASASGLVQGIAGQRPDLIHLHNIAGFSPILYSELTSSLPATPVVHTLHDYYHACPRKTLLDRRGRLCRRRHLLCGLRSRAIRTLVPSTVRFVSPSGFLKAYYVSLGLLPEDRVSVIPNGVPQPHGYPESVSEWREKREPGPTRVLFLGQLAAHKGLRTLLAVIRRFSKDPRVVFTVAGEGPWRQEAAAAPGLEYLGSITGREKHEAMRGADVLVVPSEWYENLPLAILEALNYGLAVIGTRIGGIPELVTDGWNGRVVPPADAAALGGAIDEACADPAVLLRWQSNSLRRSADFQLDAILDRYEELYTYLVGRTDAC